MPGRFPPLLTALLSGAACCWPLWAGAQPAPSPAPAKPAVKTTSPDTSGPQWHQLSPAQRQALAPLQKDWSGIDGPRKAKWLEIAARYPSLPPGEQQRLQARMTEWARMTPTERGRARLSFQEAQQLSPQQRQERWEAYKALPEDERRALAERAKPVAPRPAAAASAPLEGVVPKRTAAASAPAQRAGVKPVAPTVVQVAPGATTTLMTKTPSPPPHQKPGQPKIVASPSQVDRATLLPKDGPQAPIASQAAASGVAPAQ